VIERSGSGGETSMSETEAAAAVVAVACVSDVISNILEWVPDQVSLFRAAPSSARSGAASWPTWPTFTDAASGPSRAGSSSCSPPPHSSASPEATRDRGRPPRCSRALGFVPSPGSVLGPQCWFLNVLRPRRWRQCHRRCHPTGGVRRPH